MQKKIIDKNEIKLVGLSARTNNQNEMNSGAGKIGPLYGRYMSENIAAQIPDRKNPGTTFSVYTSYDSDEHGDYTFFLGEEVNSFDHVPSDLQKLVISPARYQRFTTASGKMPQVIIDAWQQIWQMNANDFGGQRAYQADFEIHDQRSYDPNNAAVDIYIGIKG